MTRKSHVKMINGKPVAFYKNTGGYHEVLKPKKMNEQLKAKAEKAFPVDMKPITKYGNDIDVNQWSRETYLSGLTDGVEMGQRFAEFKSDYTLTDSGTWGFTQDVRSRPSHDITWYSESDLFDLFLTESAARGREGEK